MNDTQLSFADYLLSELQQHTETDKPHTLAEARQHPESDQAKRILAYAAWARATDDRFSQIMNFLTPWR